MFWAGCSGTQEPEAAEFWFKTKKEFFPAVGNSARMAAIQGLSRLRALES